MTSGGLFAVPAPRLLHSPTPWLSRPKTFSELHKQYSIICIAVPPLQLGFSAMDSSHSTLSQRLPYHIRFWPKQRGEKTGFLAKPVTEPAQLCLVEGFEEYLHLPALDVYLVPSCSLHQLWLSTADFAWFGENKC